MLIINGWINIMFDDDNLDENDIQNLISLIKIKIEPHNILNQYLGIKNLNGFYTLFIGVNHNHDTDFFDELSLLIIEIGKLTPHSYGIIYIRNTDNSDEFTVYSLSKAVFAKHVDIIR